LRGPYFTSTAIRDQYILDNDLQEVPEGIAGFVEFFDARRKKLDGRLRRALGVG
jgi:hypothetical protein